MAKNSLYYCIVHSRMVMPELGLFKGQTRMMHNKQGDEYLKFASDVCFGPFAHCPPPDITEDQWEQILKEVDNGEIESETI